MFINKKLILRFVAISLAVIAIFFIWQARETEKNGILQPDSDLDNLNNLIRLYDPDPDTAITSPILIRGTARGFWYFEADFPITIEDENGNQLGIGIAQAQDDPSTGSGQGWMTEDFVSFNTLVYFKKPTTSTGYIVLHKSNASGLPEHDNELRVPIKFGLVSSILNCKPTGCSGQICSDEDVITTCEFRPEYACYQNAICERQLNGECGWTQTQELLSCLNSL